MGAPFPSAMQALFQNLAQWYRQVYSLQLVFILLLLGAAVAHLVRNAKTLPDRRFVALSVLVGLLGCLAIGAGFRTPLVARYLHIIAGSMVERSLSWIKAMIALGAAGLSIYEVSLVAEKKSFRKVWS